jgi:phosphoenolpyruvate-protein kinase (PTS system EI component)
VPEELERLASAFDASLTDIQTLQDATARQLGQDIASIFDFHHGVLSQSHLREQVASLITDRQYNAAYAAREVLRGYQRRFLNMETLSCGSECATSATSSGVCCGIYAAGRPKTCHLPSGLSWSPTI